MIIFLTTQKHQYTHKDVAEAAAARIDIRMLSYEELFPSPSIETATYIFTDLDRLSGPDLNQAALAYRRLKTLGLRVLNDPAQFYSRSGLLRLLFRAGINAFNAYRVEERRAPQKWPVFVRCASGHGKTTKLLNNIDELTAAIRKCVHIGYPRSDLLIVEYAGEEVQPGLYRKLSNFRIGPASVATSNVHQDFWAAKTGVKGIATPELYADELRIVRDNPNRAALDKVFQLANIDYGRGDYGFYKGQIQIFEINTNPEIHFPTEHPSPDRVVSYRFFKENYFNALAAIDSPPGQVFSSKEQDTGVPYADSN